MRVVYAAMRPAAGRRMCQSSLPRGAAAVLGVGDGVRVGWGLWLGVCAGVSMSFVLEVVPALQAAQAVVIRVVARTSPTTDEALQWVRKVRMPHVASRQGPADRAWEH